MKNLLRAISNKAELSGFTYVKIKMIIKIFIELNIVSIDEIDDTSFTFKFNYSKNKTNLEKSSILRKIRNQYSAK
jgi:hypothetical protein